MSRTVATSSRRRWNNFVSWTTSMRHHAMIGPELAFCLFYGQHNLDQNDE